MVGKMKINWDAFWKEAAHGHYRAQCGALIGTSMLAFMAALTLWLSMSLDSDVSPLPIILKGFACLAICLICCYMYIRLKAAHEVKKKDKREDPTRLE
jgi:Ca2+/Na+ antiporter